MPTFLKIYNIFNQNGVRVQTAYLVLKFFRKYFGGAIIYSIFSIKKNPSKSLSYNYLYNELHHYDFK